MPVKAHDFRTTSAFAAPSGFIRVCGLDCPFAIPPAEATAVQAPPVQSLHLPVSGLGSGLAVKPSPTLSGSTPGISTGAPNLR